MKISAISSQRYNYMHTYTTNNIKQSTPNLAVGNDSFQKNNMSFTGKKTIETSDITEATLLTGIVGAEFLLGLGLAVGMAKSGEKASKIFLDEKGFQVNTENNTISSEFVKADDDGIFQIKGTGIDINPKRFTEIDSENGIYKNAEKGIDIDLIHHKYIDPENGIFIDPDSEISTIIDGKDIEHISIPDLSFGSGQPPVLPPGGVHPGEGPKYAPSIITRSEFIDRYGVTPEDYKAQHAQLVVKVKPDDDRSTIQKIKDFFVNHDAVYDETKDYDIFGREIIKSIDKDGHSYLTSLPGGKSNKIFESFLNIGMPESDAIQMTHNIEFKSYIDTNYPDLSFGSGYPTCPWDPAWNDMDYSSNYEPPNYNGYVIFHELHKIAEDGGYYPDPGSTEAKEFFKYQVEMIKSHTWEKPMIGWNKLLDDNMDGLADMLLDTNNDGIPDAIDINGDGLPDKVISFVENNDSNNLFESMALAVKRFLGQDK